MRMGAAAIALACAVLIAGCSSEAPEPTSSAEAEFTARVTSVIARAESGGASEAQIATLRAAQEEGVLEFEPYKAAVEATFECFREHGIDYRSNGVDNSRGFPWIDYSIAGPESGPPPEATDCERAHSAFVAELYQAQPASTEALERAFLAAQPVLIACLREEGLLPLTGDPTPDDVSAAIWAGFDSAEEGSAPPGFDPTRCVSLAGISGGF